MQELMHGVLTTVPTLKREEDDEGVLQCDSADEESKPPEAEEMRCDSQESCNPATTKQPAAPATVSEEEMCDFLCKERLPRFSDIASVVCAGACAAASQSASRACLPGRSAHLTVHSAGRAEETSQREHHPYGQVSASLSR